MNPKGLVIKYWYLIALLIIVVTAFWFRSFPARYGELQALDPLYLFRMSEYALENNWQQPELDMLRYYPTGVPYQDSDYMVPIYLPAIMYTFTGFVGINMPYLHFAIIYPAIMGALAVLVGFFLGKEMFNKEAGLFIAFFMAIIPAFITRTSAGFFEKESIGAVFMLLTLYLFIKGFKKKSIKYGILAGLSMAVLTGGWGGSVYVYLVISGFIALLFALNIVFSVLGYLFTGLKSLVSDLEPYFGTGMLRVYIPMILLGTLLPQLAPRYIGMSNPAVLLSYAIIAVLVFRVFIKRFSLLREEHVQYFIPAVMVFGFIGLLIGSMFFEPFGGVIQSATGLLFAERGVIGTTVAEYTPGNWGSITGMLGTQYSGSVVSQFGALAPYLALWIFMVFGILLLVYKLFRTRNWMLLIPLFWVLSSIWAVFHYTRLIFLLGPAAAVVGGFFVYWLVSRAHRVGKSIRRLSFNVMIRGMEKRVSVISVVLALFVISVLGVNFAHGYAYSKALSPSICFPDSNILIDGEKCIVVNEDGSYTYAPNQPWYQAMGFLSNTSQDHSVLSWWDFGYWFQARGNKPSVADGGNIYGARNHEIAEWFVSPTSNWSGWVPWMEYHAVDYILMDYTLPGKFGAISKIASNGENIIGFLQFSQSNTFSQGNSTIYEFKNGPYVVWLPMDQSGNVASSPVFLVVQNDQYYSKQYINDVCTDNGIIHMGDETPSMGGCVSISKLGIYYIPEEAKESIFVNLMFMEGYGLPLEKVFDNRLITIYEVEY